MKRIESIYLFLTICAGILPGCSTTGSTPPDGQSEQHSFVYDGINRTYLTYLPTGIENSRNVPLLVALHGGGGSAKKWPEYTNNGFERIADREHFILVYPDGIENQWNDGRGVERFRTQRENIDDSGFLARLIDRLVATYPIDTDRVYVTGASNGGMMAHRLAAEHADKLAAIAPVISAIPNNLEGKMHPSHPVSVLVMNGTEDSLVRWDGGPITFGRKTNGSVISTDKTVKFWADHNHCTRPTKTSELPDTDPEDGTTITRTSYTHCKAGTAVVLYKVTGGGHTWPILHDKRGPIARMLAEKVIGRRSRDIDACEVIWRFFKNHPKRRVPR